jgi:hypothetical protein
MKLSAVILALLVLAGVSSAKAGPTPRPVIDKKMFSQPTYDTDRKRVESKPQVSKAPYIQSPYHFASPDANKRKLLPKQKGAKLQRVPIDRRTRSHFSEGD